LAFECATLRESTSREASFKHTHTHTRASHSSGSAMVVMMMAVVALGCRTVVFGAAAAALLWRVGLQAAAAAVGILRPPSGAPHGPCGPHGTLDSLPHTHTQRGPASWSLWVRVGTGARFAPADCPIRPSRTEGPEIRPDAQQQQKRSVRESPLSLLTRPRAARCCCLSWWWSWRWSTLIGWWAGR